MKFEVDPEKAAAHMLEYAMAVKARYEANDSLVAHYDLELTDLNHMIEFSNFSASKGYQLVSMVRENRRKRRACKNENIVLKRLYEFLTNGNDNMLKALAKVEKDTNSTIGSVANQQYFPRTGLFSKDEFDLKEASG